MGKKYLICDSARADWGKTETLLEVIEILNSPKKPHYKLIYEKPNTVKDKLCVFEGINELIAVSTLGDPNSQQADWLEEAAKTEAKIIVTASRTKGSTINVVYDIARKYGYDILWFQNFHFDNSAFVGLPQMRNIRMKEAEYIVGIIELL